MTTVEPFNTTFLQNALSTVFAEWVRMLELRLISASPETMAFGDIRITAGAELLAAHATTRYALL